MLSGLAARAQLQVDRLRTVVFFLLLLTDDLIRACLILLLLVPGSRPHGITKSWSMGK